MSPLSVDWQPRLSGALLTLEPLREEHFEELFAAASDPLIWEQHPDRLRHTRERFEVYFRSGMDSKGALLIRDRATGKIIGCSRFTGHAPATSHVEIGYTFLIRSFWGGGYNRELKTLMLDHAFGQVDTVYFVVGRDNLRSRKAMLKVGATELRAEETPLLSSPPGNSVVFKIAKRR